ncbi:hypothetical protein BC938DRAFT_484322, partial [Jimgerdemannia flammicorona]
NSSQKSFLHFHQVRAARFENGSFYSVSPCWVNFLGQNGYWQVQPSGDSDVVFQECITIRVVIFEAQRTSCISDFQDSLNNQNSKWRKRYLTCLTNILAEEHRREL